MSEKELLQKIEAIEEKTKKNNDLLLSLKRRVEDDFLLLGFLIGEFQEEGKGITEEIDKFKKWIEIVDTGIQEIRSKLN